MGSQFQLAATGYFARIATHKCCGAPSQAICSE